MKAAIALLWLGSTLAAQVKLPRADTVTLPNGLRLILLPRQEVPLVTVRLLARGGAEADPPDQAGLGDMVGELLQRGTAGLDAAAFAAKLDALGAALQIATDAQATAIQLEFLAKDAGPAMDLLHDAVAHPAFAEGEVKKALAEAAGAVKSGKDDAGEAIRSYAAAMMFGEGHPYGRAVDERSLGRVTREGIAAYHRRYYVGRNMIAVIAGSFDAAAMRSRVESTLGTLPAGEAHTWLASAAPPAHAKARLLLVDKPDATQTYFSIMMPGIERGNPARAGLWLVNTLFGDRFTSMLNDALRVSSGLTYGASSRMQLNRMPGSIAISSYTKNETTAQAIDLALTVLRRLREKGIDAARLASARSYLKGTFPAQALETDAQLAAVFGDLELFGLNRGEIDDLYARLDAVTPERATALARQYFTEANLQFCLVGKAEEIRGAVAKYAQAMKVISISEPGYAVPAF